MKVKSFQIPALSSQIQSDFDAILVYGTDEGEILHALTQIKQQLKLSSDTITTFTKEQLKKTPLIITDEANTTSLIHERRFLFVPDDISFSFESFIHYLDNKKTDALLLINGGNLTKTNGVRLEAERNPRVLAVACYAPTPQELQNTISSFFHLHKKTIAPAVITAFLKKTSFNQQVINQELEKLLLYVGDNREITLTDIQACVTDSADFSLDDFCTHLADGHVEQVINSLHIFVSADETETTLFWAVRNYFERLLKILSDKTCPPDQAVQKNLKPFQFYLKDPLLRQIRYWRPKDVLDVLNKITKLERLTRTTGYPKAILIEQAFLSLATKAKKINSLG